MASALQPGGRTTVVAALRAPPSPLQQAGFVVIPQQQAAAAGGRLSDGMLPMAPGGSGGGRDLPGAMQEVSIGSVGFGGFAGPTTAARPAPGDGGAAPGSLGPELPPVVRLPPQWGVGGGLPSLSQLSVPSLGLDLGIGGAESRGPGAAQSSGRFPRPPSDSDLLDPSMLEFLMT